LTSSKNINKVCAVIPFYNEFITLKEIILKTLPFVDKLILVNDGSTDDYFNEIPIDDKIILLNHQENLGKGEALKTGLIKSIELKSEFTITLDADLQHDPQKIPTFIEKIENCDCLIGSRQKNNNMPYHRKMSNYLTSKLLSFKTNTKILDSQSGYRIFRTNILQNVLPKFSGFEAESEMIVKICKQNYKIGFTEIPTIYGNDNSKMKAIPAILGFIKVLLFS
jgi:glycosyltransferase involved in cell wall biosynthesis